MPEPIRVGHLSDTHFLAPGERPEGAHGYDTAAAFAAVVDHMGDHGHLDFIAITGDIADHGRADQYELAAAAFSRFEVPVNVCPGNHDFDEPFRLGFDGHALGTDRLIEIGQWAFVFADSSAGKMVSDGDGGLVDPPGSERLHSNGALGEHEAAFVRESCAQTDLDNVFVWLHHPPGVDVPLVADENYSAEWLALLADLPEIRGLGGGHTHIPAQHEVAGRQVFVAPSLKNNFDLVANTWLPPGYRTYEFHPDGRVESELHLVDDERWPRRPLGRALRSLFAGELTYDQLAEIVARRAASSSSE